MSKHKSWCQTNQYLDGYCTCKKSKSFWFWLIALIKVSKKSRCSHLNLCVIYGDKVIFATPNNNRLQCIDCGKFLDGSVKSAELRKGQNK